MKLNLRKVMAENSIKKIRKQLEELETLDTDARSQPVEQTNDTYVIRTHENEKQKLLAELGKYQKILDEKD
jgi:hypothetical protein